MNIDFFQLVNQYQKLQINYEITINNIKNIFLLNTKINKVKYIFLYYL
jgi:hypothetical protein